MPGKSWDEIRIAYHVARAGTVSAAAEALGVHHATVIRHVDALERRLGVRLFQRHTRGYTPTEAGAELLRVAQATDDQFAQMVARLRGRGEAVEGELIVTSLHSAAPLLAPALTAFRAAHPAVIVRYLTGDAVLRLEYGEAHVALRAGAKPNDPDNVVQPFGAQEFTLYASRSYLLGRGGAPGEPPSEEDLAAHDFVGPDDAESRAPFARWLRAAVPAGRVVFRANDPRVVHAAVRAGAGIGFCPVWEAEADPELVPVLPPRHEWSAPLWLVTHVDLHRTAKVQALLRWLKSSAGDWEARRRGTAATGRG